MSVPEVLIHRDGTLLAQAVAARLVTSLVDSVSARGAASVVLTGGGIGTAVLTDALATGEALAPGGQRAADGRGSSADRCPGQPKHAADDFSSPVHDLSLSSRLTLLQPERQDARPFTAPGMVASLGHETRHG